MELNEEQREAVEYVDGPLLIIAGAGTGKTRVITHRIAHLISSKRAMPEEILALTFTEKAALEMEERVDILVPYGYADVWISTFHSFGDRVLRGHALEVGLTPDFRVLSQAEQVIFFREHLFEFPLNYFRSLSDPTKHIEAILKLISRAKDEDVSPEEYLLYAENINKDLRVGEDKDPELDSRSEIAQRQMELARTYKKYQELLAKEGFVDFGDQVNLTLKLFREHPSILKKYQKNLRYILVDEFQDTNYAQFQLVRLLGEGHRNITVVGDDDQSIYKFRGAAISNILNFINYYPDAKQVVLTKNYRSGQRLLDSAYRLIQHNNPDRLELKNKIDKRLIALEEGIPVSFLQYDTVSSEADGVARLIEERCDSGYRFNDIAILVRSNKDADPYLRSLNMKGIPYRFTGNRGLYVREEVRLLIAFLKAISRFDDSASLYHLASSEIYRVNGYELTLCMNKASRINQSLHYIFSHLDDIPGIEELSIEGRATIEKLMGDIKRYVELANDLPTGQLLYAFLTESGYLGGLSGEGTPSADEKVQNIAKFFDIVKNFGYIAQLDRARYFVDYLELLMEAGDDPASSEAGLEADAVQVMTIHKAKGLEFPIVFLVSLVERRFPTEKRGDLIELPDPLIKDTLPTGDFHMEEERRLFYVGMTRSQKELYLTAARDYGGTRIRKLSRFVREALDIPDLKERIFKTSSLETLKGFATADREDTPSEPIPEDIILPLSYYQIDDYKTCPLKYKYVHILRVPILQHHTVIYGMAIHEAIKEYNRRKVMGGKEVTVEDLITVFERSWRGEGFLTREHESQRFEAGKEALRRFISEQEGKRPPTYVEKEFSFLIKKNLIRGRWDRIDIEDGKVVIIDYKTSEVRKEKDAHRKANESLQLSIYALAYRERFGKIPDRLELRFVDAGLVGITQKTEKDLNYTIDVIEEVAEGIRKRSFSARPGYISCSYCAYQQICPA